MQVQIRVLEAIDRFGFSGIATSTNEYYLEVQTEAAADLRDSRRILC